MIAITVSTNYHDLLPIVYHYNKDYFKHWVFVTDKNDNETIKFLSDKPNVTVLYWNFKNERRLFDKGGAIRHAQYFVYDRFPDEWYLLIDSDICLPPTFNLLESYLTGFDTETIYGLVERFDFESLSDLRILNNYKIYDNNNFPLGYFQLYKKRLFYENSNDASRCDGDFALRFSKQIMISGISCAHLGNKSHWNGDRRPSSDFNQ